MKVNRLPTKPNPQNFKQDPAILRKKTDTVASINENLLLPFTSVKIKGTIKGAIAKLDIDLLYINPFEEPLECIYEFPLDKNTIFAKLIATIGNDKVEAEVKEKVEA